MIFSGISNRGLFREAYMTKTKRVETNKTEKSSIKIDKKQAKSEKNTSPKQIAKRFLQETLE